MLVWAGWIDCNILLENIPQKGRIAIVENGNIIETKDIIEKVSIADTIWISDINNREWLFDVLLCVKKLEKEFTLDEVYSFEVALSHITSNEQ